MIQKINIASSIAALVLFFIPWLDIQCSNHSVATQSGLQTIYGGMSPSKEMSEMARSESKKGKSSSKDDSAGISILVAVAFLAVAGAVVASFLIFKGASGVHPQAPGILCAAALACIAAQMATGFPVTDMMKEGMRKESGGRPDEDALAAASAGMASAMIQVRHLPGLYLELIILGIPTLVFANSLLDRMKGR